MTYIRIEPIEQFITRIWNHFFSTDAEGSFPELRLWIETDRANVEVAAEEFQRQHLIEAARIVQILAHRLLPDNPEDDVFPYERDTRRWLAAHERLFS